MKAQRHHTPEVRYKNRKHTSIDPLTRAVKTMTSALIGILLTSLFSIVVFAFVIKAFLTGDEMSLRLLNSATTVLGTALGAALGYYFGRTPR